MALSIILALVLAVAVLVLITLPRVRKGLERLRKLIREIQSGAHAALSNEALMLVVSQQIGEVRLSADPGAPSVLTDGHWEKLAGHGKGWPAGTYYKVRALAALGGDLYASLTGPRQDGPIGEVWRFSHNEWTCVGGGNTGPWQEESSVDQVFEAGNALYVAERGGVWRMKDGHWTALGDGLELDPSCGPYCFAEWQGRVVMGQWGKPRVAVLSDGGQWTYLPVPQDGWGARARTIYCLVSWRGHLYAATGTGTLSGPGATVWRFDGRTWEKVAGGGLRGSWSQSGIPFVLSLCVFQDRLIATVSRPISTPSAASNVWAFDGERWGAVAVGASPELMSASLIMNDAVVYRDRLVVATGHSVRLPAQIWELGHESCWSAVGPDDLAEPGEGDGGWWVYDLYVDGGYLYAATAGHKGAAAIFRFIPTAGI